MDKINKERVSLGVIAIIYCYIFTTYLITMSQRRFTFNGQFMKQFKEINMKDLKKERAGELGYPDTGSGRYSEKLTYEDWFVFNCAQRCQMNFFEQLPIVLICAAISSLRYPHRTF